MKIAINTRLLLPGQLEGIGWFTHELVSRIATAHPEVEFHFLFDRPFDARFIPAQNVVPHIVYPPARHPFLYKVWYDLAVPRVLERIRPDLFVSPDGHASLRCPVPQLTVIHDINFEHYPEDVPPVHSWYLRRYSRRYARASRRIVTVSAFSRTDIMERYGISGSVIDVVPNAAASVFRPLQDAERQQARMRFADGRPYFISVGAIHPRKNLQRVLPAFDQFKEDSGSEMQLVVVGSQRWMAGEIRTAFERMRHRTSVRFVGRLEQPDLALATGGADASLYCSYFEGFGIPVVEAFQCGVPVITSSVSSLPEVAGGAALLCDPFSIADITTQMKAVATQPALVASLRSKGRLRAQDFSWEKSAVLFWNSMQRCLDDTHGA